MKGVFYDASATMLAKNHLPIVSYFQMKDPAFKAVFISAETSSNTNQQITEASINKIISKENNSFIQVKSFSHKKIEKTIEDIDPDFLFIGAYRIYDQLWSGICKLQNIKVFKIQHGFEIDSLYYKPSAVIAKLFKSIRLIYAAYNLAKVLKSNPLKVIYQYSRYIFTGVKLKDTSLNNPILYPTVTFVYSEYYKNFWNNKFGISKEQMSVITPQDFLLIDEVAKLEKQNACCYITQTLVEDRRMQEKDFIELLINYEKIIKNVNKFIIKLHPRANIKYYESLSKFDNVDITRDFPNCTCYLTHYSSMLYTAAFFSNTLIIHELKGHPTPEIFKNIASNIVYTADDVIKVIQSKDSNLYPSIEDRKKAIKYYASFENSAPYQTIYNEILKHLTR